MSSAAITTVVTILESLPRMSKLVSSKHLSEYLMDLQDETEWDRQFEESTCFGRRRRRAKEQSAEGLARPLDYDQL